MLDRFSVRTLITIDFYCGKVLNYRIIFSDRRPCRLSTSSCITLVNCFWDIFPFCVNFQIYWHVIHITSLYYPSDICRLCSDVPLFILILGLLVFFLISLAGILSILSFLFPDKQLSASLSFFLLCLLFNWSLSLVYHVYISTFRGIFIVLLFVS